MTDDRLNKITGDVVERAIKVHKALGPGLLESAYESCLEYELQNLDYRVERQKAMPLVYENIGLDLGYRIDLFVEGLVIVECKSVREVTPLDQTQLLSYLKLNNFPVGLLININVQLLKDGIQRLAN